MLSLRVAKPGSAYESTIRKGLLSLSLVPVFGAWMTELASLLKIALRV